ncbi:hypothetical protein PGN35_009890 [Nodosilinea sp. PGN35]|uniref:hypothetical protein n=1 Tax=Nodosilinea sp. PGN35 TaxID=3020489 RepID=UPI0023B28C2C|nr:hypothetical protein [Nodosilinea sp. TSF1-S3]MDF0366659.1 hypothetical protein [Nodosilinea sp. TSF1-S3]
MKAIAVALGLGSLLVAGCAQNPLRSPEALLDPQQVVSQCPAGTTPGAVELLGSRQEQGRAIVLYRTTCSGADPDDPYQNYELLGDSVFARVGGLWQLQGAGAVARNVDERSRAEAEADYIDLIGSTVRQSPLHPTIKTLRGRIHSPAVRAVEVVLENGTTLRDEGTDSIYAIFIPANQSPREVRVVGEDNQILRQENYPQS